MVRGLENLGATCWLNALVQCLRASLDWNNVTLKKSDEFANEFLRLMRGDTDNTTLFLRELPMDPFGNNPSDSQEALLYILDRLGLDQFTGKVEQTVIYPGGRSTYETDSTIWFGPSTKEEVISGYEDRTGKIHSVAVIQRRLSKVPDVLVSDIIQEELHGKKLVGIVHWGFGHYIAFVRSDGDWWCVDDAHAAKSTPVLRGYMGFYN